jgi:hypothetical protein
MLYANASGYLKLVLWLLANTLPYRRLPLSEFIHERFGLHASFEAQDAHQIGKGSRLAPPARVVDEEAWERTATTLNRFADRQ